MKGFRGAGNVRMALFDETTGLLINKWYPFGNLVSLVMTPEAEPVDVLSTDHATYGQVLDTMDDPKPTKGKISSNRFDHRTIAIAFMGEDVLKADAEATVTDEAHTASLDNALRLAKGDVSAVVVTDSTAVTTYVLDTDYTVSTGPGFAFVTPLSTGAITEDEALLIDYTAAAGSGYKIEGGSKPSRKIALLFDGRNQMDNTPTLLDVFQCTIKPSGGFDLMSKDPATQEYDITPILMPGKTSTYEVHVK
ncbi:MAG: hypothetical protein KKC77_18420 [Proteobacteria bacterium]|nr:hypothetical protein [Pseudomonadota bacterium]